MIRFLAAVALTVASTLPAYAQRQRCGTSEPVVGGESGPSDCGSSTNTPKPEYEPTCFYDIQVVFHVIRNTAGQGHLSPATIQDQIDVLNEDFQAIQGSPGAPGTNAKVRFFLATVDPDGNPTTGITYSNNNSWYLDSGNYWNSLAWDTNRYMNVYTNSLPCCYGYVSGFPSQGIAGQADDRIVVWWEAVGRQPTSGWPLNMGRTLTHETGHYLGLYHTFCGGCGSQANCYGTGDLICDTNGQSSPTFGCPGGASSCGSPDPFHNYMDYTDDPCLWEFTPEQANRIRCSLVNWRPNVYRTSSSHAVYCTAKVNSCGTTPAISATGFSSASATSGFTIDATNAKTGKSGLLIYTDNGRRLPAAPFGQGGLLCIASPLKRAPIKAASGGSAGQCDATFSLDMNAFAAGLAGGNPQAYISNFGTMVNCQWWGRDTVPHGSFLSDALEYTVCP